MPVLISFSLAVPTAREGNATGYWPTEQQRPSLHVWGAVFLGPVPVDHGFSRLGRYLSFPCCPVVESHDTKGQVHHDGYHRF